MTESQGNGNPWVSELGPECRESQSTTNSSSSSRTYRGHHAPTPPWLCNHRTLQPGHHVEAVIEIPHAGVSNPLLHPQSAPTLVPAGSGGGGKPPPGAASDRERPVTPASSPAGSGAGGAVAGCGGHCVAFENFCYYCLQMVFVAGILTGVSLTIAGSVLRGQKRGGDLMVLVYIGCLVAMVCTLLLSVHCCVRRNVKRRKRALRRRGGGVGVVDHVGIPLQDLAQRPGPSHHHLQQQHHYQPLVSRLVQQQQQASSAQVVVVDNQRHHPQYHHHHQPNFSNLPYPKQPANSQTACHIPDIYHPNPKQPVISQTTCHIPDIYHPNPKQPAN
uniref:(California timema) hypothetical protein n=1 Tax=Timema californicum TaxID=61474 RepID=A0A7R9JEW7_TIMCA|nr:unnamed protein product [Timema californicum]